MDNSRNLLGGFSFPSSSLNGFSVGGLPSIGQFPSQRLQASSFSGLSDHSPGVQSPLGILSDIASGEGMKRIATDELQKAESKRLRIATQQSSSSLLKDNPYLLERLSTMRGGFPMPKWGGAKQFALKTKQTRVTKRQLSSAKHGGFPMPSISGKGAKDVSSKSFNSYKQLWYNTDIDLREEVLARKLERGSHHIPFNR